MSRQFTIILKNEDLSVADVYMAIEKYTDEMFYEDELDDTLDFEVSALD